MSHQKSRYEHDPPRIFKQLQPKKQIWTGRILMIHMGGGYPRLHTKPLCWREIYTFILCAEILWCIFVGWVGFWKHSLHTKHVRMILFCPRNMNGTVSNWKKVVEFACSWKTHIYIYICCGLGGQPPHKFVAVKKHVIIENWNGLLNDFQYLGTWHTYTCVESGYHQRSSTRSNAQTPCEAFWSYK